MLRFLFAGFILLIFSAGCTMSHVQVVESESMTVSESENADEFALGHVYANSWGIYLFSKVPIVTGGINSDGEPVWSYFKDTVLTETVVDLIRTQAMRMGATHVVDMQTNWISEWGGPFMLIFWLVETEASANAIRVKGGAPFGALPVEDEDFSR